MPSLSVGDKYGRLEVMALLRGAACVCRCECGTTKEFLRRNLRSGATKSCGCYKAESNRQRFTTHGQAAGGKERPLVYGVWSTMKSRCLNPNFPKYQIYGARGITVCDRWLTFANFYEDMGDPPPGLTLERRDNDGNYEPGNCVWASRAQQSRNKRTNRFFTIDGETLCLQDVANKFGVSADSICCRLNRGQTIEQAVSG